MNLKKNYFHDPMIRCNACRDNENEKDNDDKKVYGCGTSPLG